MGTYIKYLIFFALLCSCVNLKGQDVNFSVVLNGNIVNYTVQNNTSKDMYIIQHREPTMENGSHCLITYKDKDGNVNYEMLPVINKLAVLIKPKECYNYDIDISSYKKQGIIRVYCKLAVIVKDENDKPYIKKYDKYITF